MPYETFAVANSLIDLADLAGQRLNSVRLQKLVYYAHGWHLAIDKSPLINETIEARPYGIIIPSICNGFKEFGIDPIQGHLTEFDATTNNWVAPKITIDHGIALALLESIGRTYEVYDTVQLCNLTHLPGSPWQLARQTANDQRRYPAISDDLFLDSFSSLVRANKQQKDYNYFGIRISDIQAIGDHVQSEPDETTLSEYAFYEQEAKKLHGSARKGTWKRVIKCSLSWDTSARTGLLTLHLVDGVKYDIKLNSSQELDGVRKTMHREKAIFYNIVSGSIAWGWRQLSGATGLNRGAQPDHALQDI